MEDFKVESIILDDGRRGEKRVKDSENEHVVEIHIEPERPKYLGKRIVETKRPCVVRRQVETFNEKGEVVDTKVEALNSEEKFYNVTPQPSPEYVTKADLNEFAEKVRAGIVAAVTTSQEPVKSMSPKKSPYNLAAPVDVPADKPKSNKMFWILLIVGQLAALWYLWQM